MAFQPVPKTCEVDIRGTLWGQLIENTIYVSQDTSFTGGDVADAAAAVRGWWFASVMPILSSAYTFRECFAKDLESAAPATATDIAGSGTAGSVATSSGMPGNVALAVSFRTAAAGRSYRGRNYVSGIPEGNVSGNQVIPGYQTAVQEAYNALLTALVSTAFRWVVVSRVNGGARRAVGEATDIIAAVLVDAFLDSQRRRLTGRGQ